ncbi:MAG TPA: hypothetical protein DEF43_09170 [Chloroflexus aurantiacus]|jgi:hypothetical protein|uniref:Uncharacterized protein n=1 Tax=Chloroflexus aurantiacus (strain ATCC 29366 / DSM 635 / J-10-fl) TaxID=324602 RepID=A9WFQ3_CHLAA|nr:hypothetical protein [Chloroflexus aurantiacus]ABY35403.1 conserved hypothetical protein [Chloroflexus aurantiacus J-10-fl]RMG45933.1 MAG: hypothetical protein D6716_19035 [Chloroflexota bacterium]HBW67315.1 hypothetical protein [Chloroflexus aurantiacus]
MSSETTSRPPKRYARIAPLYKAMIWTSFIMNAVLLIVLGIVIGILVMYQRQVAQLTENLPAFAANNLAELQDVVDKLESATIVYTVPLSTRLPIELDVPINGETIMTERNVVTLTEPVSLQAPAQIAFPGGGGNLNASVAIVLPAGLELPVDLNMNVKLVTSIPVELDVPVNIPLAQTELGPQFTRLGAIVDRLVAPVAPLLPMPATPPDSSQPRRE